MALPKDENPGSNEVPEVPTPEAVDDAGIPDDGDDVNLDMAADSLLAEVNDSHDEVQRMIAMQKDTAMELGDLKSQLETELHQLQEESWRLQAFNELEVLKRQLEALNHLEADLDAAEAVLDAGDRSAGGAGPARDDDVDVEVDDEEEEEEDYNPEDVEALQMKLDKELDDMFAQLQSVRNEAASVSARKAQLESELKALLEMQLTDEDLELEIAAAEAAVAARAAAGDGLVAATPAAQAGTAATTTHV